MTRAQASELAPLIEGWLPLAAGQREAIDNLIGLLRCAPLDEQRRLGLPWVRALGMPHPDHPAVTSFLIGEWLDDLYGAGPLDEPARGHYQVLVDGLAASGMSKARELQRRTE